MKSRDLFLLITIALCSNYAAADRLADLKKEREYYEEVRTKITEKCRGTRNYRQCRSDLTPSKCKPLAFNEDLSAWAACVRSCAHAGLFGRTFGECSS